MAALRRDILQGLPTVTKSTVDRLVDRITHIVHSTEDEDTSRRQIAVEDFEPVIKKLVSRKFVNFLKTKGYLCYSDLRALLKHDEECGTPTGPRPLSLSEVSAESETETKANSTTSSETSTQETSQDLQLLEPMDSRQTTSLKTEIQQVLPEVPESEVNMIIDRITSIIHSKEGMPKRELCEQDFEPILKKLLARRVVKSLKKKGFTRYSDLAERGHSLTGAVCTSDTERDTQQRAEGPATNTRGHTTGMLSNTNTHRYEDDTRSKSSDDITGRSRDDTPGRPTKSLSAQSPQQCQRLMPTVQRLVQRACVVHCSEVLAQICHIASKQSTPDERELHQDDLHLVLKRLAARRVIRRLKSKGFLCYGDVRASLRHNAACSTRTGASPLSLSKVSEEPDMNTNVNSTPLIDTETYVQGVGEDQAFSFRSSSQKNSLPGEEEHGFHTRLNQERAVNLGHRSVMKMNIVEAIRESGVIEKSPLRVVPQNTIPAGGISVIDVLSDGIFEIASSSDCPRGRVLEEKDFQPVLKKLQARRLISYFGQRGYKHYWDFRKPASTGHDEMVDKTSNDDGGEHSAFPTEVYVSRITIGTLKEVPEVPSHQYDPKIDDSMEGDDNNTSLPMTGVTMEKAEDQGEKDKAEVQDCLNKLKEQVDSQCNSEERDRFQGIFDSLMQEMSQQTNLPHSTQPLVCEHLDYSLSAKGSDPVHDEGASGVATDEQVPDPDRGHDDHHDLNAILGLIHSTTGAMHRDLNLLMNFIMETGVCQPKTVLLTHRKRRKDSILDRNLPDLLKTINISPLFRAILVKKHVFQHEQLVSTEKMNNHEGVEHILKLLRGATDDQFESFICALEETNQEYAASLLRQEVEEPLGDPMTVRRANTAVIISTNERDEKTKNLWQRFLNAIKRILK